jgi:tRNA threonylcarbamoyladenosine biosynthesis protein TsaE
MESRRKSIDVVVEPLTTLTGSYHQTIAFGEKLGNLLTDGDLVALMGVLGSGKTWFTKGIALGLGVNKKTVITSPSFALVNEYEGRHTLYHMDVYRLDSLSEFFSAGLEEYFYRRGVVVMEWADRWPQILPEMRLQVKFVIIDDHRRAISLSGHHGRALEIIQAVRQIMGRG